MNWPPLLPRHPANPDVQSALAPFSQSPLLPQRFFFYNNWTGGQKGIFSARDLNAEPSYSVVPRFPPSDASEVWETHAPPIDTAPADETGVGQRAKVHPQTSKSVDFEYDHQHQGVRTSIHGRTYNIGAQERRHHQAHKSERPPWYKRAEVVALGLFTAWFTVGYLAYTTQPWTISGDPFSSVDSIYLLIQILTTVGYGDVVPHHFAGKLFTSAYVLIAIVMITALVTQAAESIMLQQKVNVKLDKGVDQEPESKYANLLWNVSIFGTVMSVGVLYCLLFPAEFIKPLAKTDIGQEAISNEFVDALYFVIITMTTVGFGDIYPATDQGRIVMSIWMIVAVGSTASLVGSFTETLLKIKADMRVTQLSAKLLQELDTSGDGQVSQYEFLVFMLKKYDLVQTDTIADIEANFKSLDKDGSGYLSAEDLKSLL